MKSSPQKILPSSEKYEDKNERKYLNLKLNGIN